MRFETTLLAVKDMNKSLTFYKEIFGQDVKVDLGWNKTLTCGLTLQENFDKLLELPKENMKFKTYNMEIYFETEDMDKFMELLNSHTEIERVHELKTYPWHQRVIRIFDPDYHVIEVGESMKKIAFNEFEKGLTTEEVSKKIEHPFDVVNNWHREYNEH